MEFNFFLSQDLININLCLEIEVWHFKRKNIMIADIRFWRQVVGT
jgi:hypothetical protein